MPSMPSASSRRSGRCCACSPAATARRGTPEPGAHRRRLALRTRAPGADRHLRGRRERDVLGLPIALFPAVAERHGGAGVLGLLFAAGPAGSALLTLSSG